MKRPAFSVIEIIVALAVLGTAGVVIVQTASLVFREKMRSDDRERALVLAENALEESRLQPSTSLKAWAAAVKLPADVLDRWPESSMSVTIHEDALLTRITAVVQLKGVGPALAPPIQLSAWRPAERKP